MWLLAGRFTTGRSTSCTGGNGQRVRALTILPSTVSRAAICVFSSKHADRCSAFSECITQRGYQ